MALLPACSTCHACITQGCAEPFYLSTSSLCNLQDAWPEIDRLHPAAAGDGAAAGRGGSEALDWPWLEALWTCGLRHEHQQVQRLVLHAFLGRSWSQEQQAPAPTRLRDVPPAFVLHVLLPAAGQAYLWRGAGVAELQQGVAAWVGGYTAAQPAQAQRQLLLSLLDVLGGGCSGGGGSGAAQQAALRPLAQTVAAALVAAAKSASQKHAGANEQLAFLERLQAATGGLSGSWGSGGATGSFAVSMCCSLMQAAASVVELAAAAPAGSSQDVLTAAAAWLQQLPLMLLLPGGELHPTAASWLASADRQQLLPPLTSCVQSYMEGSAVEAGEQPAAETGWQQQAGALARLALLSALPPADLSAAFCSWTDTLEALYCR